MTPTDKKVAALSPDPAKVSERIANDEPRMVDDTVSTSTVSDSECSPKLSSKREVLDLPDDSRDGDSSEDDYAVTRWPRVRDGQRIESREEVDYSNNHTVFGSILRGELPALCYAESMDLFCFRDVNPQAELHALIIPKRFIKDVDQLEKDDLPLVLAMREMALQVLREEQPQALKRNDYTLCFHIPPHHTVDHLHLHVLAPASRISDEAASYGKYRTYTYWCEALDAVIGALSSDGDVRQVRKWW